MTLYHVIHDDKAENACPTVFKTFRKTNFYFPLFSPMGATWKHSPSKTAAAAAQLQFLVTKSLWVAMGSKVLSALDLDVPKQLLSFRP